MAKPSAALRDLQKLTWQLVYLANGPKLGHSIYDIAKAYAEKILDLYSLEKSKIYLRNNYGVLRAWVDENHPKCPTNNKRATRKKIAPIKRDAVLRIVPYAQRSIIDPCSDEFLTSFEWRAIRMVVLKKYGAICQCCGASAKSGAVIHVDHIKPRKKFPALALEITNLQVLCHECNHGKGNWDETDWRTETEQHA